MVMTMLSLVGSIMAEFQFSSTIDYQLALNARDELQAEFNALSALRARALLLKNSQGLRSALRQAGNALGVGQDLLPSLSQLLDNVPIECGLLSSITSVAGDEESDVDDGKQSGFFPGECMATSTGEGTKISLHALRSRNRQEVFALLVNLLSSPEFEHLFQGEDANGNVRADTPEDLVGAIADWIDDDDNQMANQVADEGRPYAFLKDDYQPKNAPFDSIAELQLVHGVDDEIYKMLKDRITIYPNNTKFVLEGADHKTILFGVLAAGAPIEQAVCVAAHAYMFMQETMGFGSLNKQILTQLASQCGLDLAAELGKVFTDRDTDTTWYTIDAVGRMGNAQRRIKAVYQAREGRFAYVRMD